MNRMFYKRELKNKSEQSLFFIFSALIISISALHIYYIICVIKYIS